MLKQTKLLFLVPIPPPAPQTFADLGGGIGPLGQDALHPPGHCVGTEGTEEEARLHICMYANFFENSDLLGNFFSPSEMRYGSKHCNLSSEAFCGNRFFGRGNYAQNPANFVQLQSCGTEKRGWCGVISHRSFTGVRGGGGARWRREGGD